MLWTRPRFRASKKRHVSVMLESRRAADECDRQGRSHRPGPGRARVPRSTSSMTIYRSLRIPGPSSISMRKTVCGSSPGCRHTDQVDDELDTRDVTLTIVDDARWVSILGRATPHHENLEQKLVSWGMDPKIENESRAFRPMLFDVYRRSTAHYWKSPGSTPVSISMLPDAAVPLLEPRSPIFGAVRHQLSPLTESEHLTSPPTTTPRAIRTRRSTPFLSEVLNAQSGCPAADARYIDDDGRRSAWSFRRTATCRVTDSQAKSSPYGCCLSIATSYIMECFLVHHISPAGEREEGDEPVCADCVG